MEPDPRWRSPGPNNWYNPRYRGGFRGNNNSYSPRHSPNNSWQQNRPPSPYNYRPQYNNFNNSPYSSTPRHKNFQSPRFFRGGGRHNRNSFGGSPNNNRSFDQDCIENWVSPQMWQDPWQHLLRDADSHTKFADTDFSEFCSTDNSEDSQVKSCASSSTTTRSALDVSIDSILEKSVEEPSQPKLAGTEVESSTEIISSEVTTENKDNIDI